MPTESFVTANGLRHHLIEWGERSSQTIVLCHGYLDMAWSFRKLAEQLEQTYRVVAIDFRGHGETEWIGRGGYYHFPDYVLDLHELIPLICEEPVHLLGHSMGGTVCAYYAALHGERLQSLTLAEGLGALETPLAMVPDKAAGFLKTVDLSRARKSKPIASRDEALKRMRVQNPDLGGEWGQFLAEKATVEIDGGYRWRFDPLHKTTSPTPFFVSSFKEFLKRISVPTLAVFGTNGYRLPDEKDRLATLTNLRTAEIEDAKHMLHWSHPTELARLLSEHVVRDSE